MSVKEKEREKYKFNPKLHSHDEKGMYQMKTFSLSLFETQTLQVKWVHQWVTDDGWIDLLLHQMFLLSHSEWVLFHSRSQIVTVYPVEWEGKGGGEKNKKKTKKKKEKKQKQQNTMGKTIQTHLFLRWKSSKFSWNWVLFFLSLLSFSSYDLTVGLHWMNESIESIF